MTRPTLLGPDGAGSVVDLLWSNHNQVSKAATPMTTVRAMAAMALATRLMMRLTI
jgi:hypothetical protein